MSLFFYFIQKKSLLFHFFLKRDIEDRMVARKYFRGHSGLTQSEKEGERKRERARASEMERKKDRMVARKYLVEVTVE